MFDQKCLIHFLRFHAKLRLVPYIVIPPQQENTKYAKTEKTACKTVFLSYHIPPDLLSVFKLLEDFTERNTGKLQTKPCKS